MDPYNNQRRQQRAPGHRGRHIANTTPPPLSNFQAQPYTGQPSELPHPQALNVELRYVANQQFLQRELAERNHMLVQFQQSLAELEGELMQQSHRHAQEIRNLQLRYNELRNNNNVLQQHLRRQDETIQTYYNELGEVYQGLDEAEKLVAEQNLKLQSMAEEISDLRQALQSGEHSPAFFAAQRRSFTFEIPQTGAQDDEEVEEDERREAKDDEDEADENNLSGGEEDAAAPTESTALRHIMANLRLDYIEEESSGEDKPEAGDEEDVAEEVAAVESHSRQRPGSR
jgi:hypothetical protein